MEMPRGIIRRPGNLRPENFRRNLDLDQPGSVQQVPDKITERIIYTGRVQGVGFRYTVRSLAGRHPVSGYVRNLPDGTVELVVAGRRAAIEVLLAEVATHFRHNIAGCERTVMVSPESFEGFDIRF